MLAPKNVLALRRGNPDREGRRQRIVRRLLIAADGKPVSTRDMVEAIFPPATLDLLALALRAHERASTWRAYTGAALEAAALAAQVWSSGAQIGAALAGLLAARR